MSTKQLYEKTSEGMKEVSPLVSIEDIYSKLSDTPLEALVSLYNHVKCEWKGSVADTRRTVPLFLRRSGLFITYNNGTKYVTEFFSAGTDQITTEGWVKDSNWTPVPDEDYISAGVKPGVGSIGYEQLNDNLKQLFREKVNVTNFPDDEDITSVDNMLKLKDREADATNFQSKGYVILRKNLRLVNGVVKNILTQNMINKPNTIYEIRYDFDLNALEITMPEYSILKFNGGTIVNGVVYSNKTKIINIPKDFNIMGNIYNINGTEITIKGDVLNKKIKILAPSVVYTPKWWKSDFGEDRFMKVARDIGITDFYSLVRIDNTTLPNYQCQPCPEFADAETLANRFLSNGYKEIFGIKFHTENNFNNTESPDKIMPNFINYIVDYVKAVINKGLILHNINIVNEEADWTRQGSEYIDYIVELANRITQLGLTPRISFDSIYNLRLADSKLYNCISPDFNFYPTISFLDRETKYDKDISNELIEGLKNTYNMAWGRYISTFGISETGICANEKAFRYPWEYRTENLGESMPKAPIIYWEIISDVINTLNCPFVNVWFFEGLTKEKNIDVDALYNIFINKIK